MASPTRAIRSGLETLLGSLTYTKESTDSSEEVPYLESRPIKSKTWFPIVRLDNILLSPDNCKDIKGWEAVVTIEVVTSTQPGHGNYNPADEIESSIISLMTDTPYALSLGAGYSLMGVLFEDSDYDESLRVLDPTNPKAKPQRVISKDVTFVVTINET